MIPASNAILSIAMLTKYHNTMGKICLSPECSTCYRKIEEANEVSFLIACKEDDIFLATNCLEPPER